MEVLKKPYEISLWDDQLIWHRRKLVNANISSASAYEPGKYYSRNQPLGGSGTDGANNSAVPYTLDYGDYVQDRVYYSLAPWTNGNYKEGENAEDVSIPNSEQINWADSVVLQYYKEIKICTIGSNTMQGEIRAVNPKLVTNVNGSNTLTFTMYYTYWDEITNQLEWNPFMMYLANERKVKLHYDEKWYDFVIKNISEDSSSKAFTYTCKDLFINELSKSGFEIELDTELVNNMGTLPKLAKEILRESDWELKDEETLIVRQYLEEPLYEIKFGESGLPSGLSLTKMYGEDTTIPFPYGKKAYLFYSSVNNELPTIQLLYDPTEEYQVDESNIVMGYSEDNTSGIYNYSLSGVEWHELSSGFGKTPHVKNGNVSVSLGNLKFCSDKRGKKLVKSVLTEYDPKAKKTVQVYKAKENDNAVSKDTIVYGYVDSEYLAPTAVINLVANSTSFSSDSGWLRRNKHGTDKTALPDLDLNQYPALEDIDDFANHVSTSCLKFSPSEAESALLNTGINNNRTSIGEFVTGNEYILRANITSDLSGQTPALNYDVVVCEYTDTDGKYALLGKDGQAIDDFKNGSDSLLFTRYYNSSVNLTGLDKDPDDSSKILYTWCDTYKCNYSLTNEELKNKKIGIFVIATNQSPIYIRDLQFFKYQLANKKNVDGSITKNVICYPGAPLESVVKTYYSYYKDFNTYDADNIQHIYRDTTPNSNYVIQYGTGARAYEKVRSITAKESNRFNLIQELCELFECWAKFTIDHDYDTGEILLDNDCRQRKWVSFHEYIGTDNPVGFRYGTNLKSIKRTLDSNGAITKIIVKNNANEQAKNGFCSISRADENPSRENSIYNFDYYVGQKLIEYESINQDLYAPTANAQGYLAHYGNLRTLNIQAQELTEQLAGILSEIAQWDSSYQTYKASYDAANSDWADQKIKFQDLTGITPERFCPEYQYWNHTQDDRINGQLIWKYYDKNPDGSYTENMNTGMWARNVWWDSDEALKILAALSRAQTIKEDHKTIYENAKNMKDLKEETKRSLQDQMDVIREKKLKINRAFYKKYSRFMQEGSWISEDYIDDNLYYIDALSTLYTSSRPKVTYTIEVVELSALPEYKNFIYSVGDKTYIEDEEFFGWAYDGSDRLYREEVIVSEITTEFDSPEKNRIKVQNYKTQFEDLFQRIAATTAQVEFSTGEYKRGAQIVESDGTISVETLQNSFKNNSITLQNSNSQSVIIGENGITITDLFKPNEQIRLISGGIFLTRDGGSNWTAGITASGINASCLTTGTINATEINITMGGVATLRWDALGISAYQNSNSGVVASTFVRFDQFGLYGIEHGSGFNALEAARKEQGVNDSNEIDKALEIIKKNANFGLTWKDFWLRSKGTNGYVSISSDRDFEVVRTSTSGEVVTETPIIKIGRLGEGNSEYYGIKINNQTGGTVFEVDQSGELWLRTKMSVQTTQGNVAIGTLGKDGAYDEADMVIDANNKFKVYEDGHIEGTDAHFSGGSTFDGTIIATGGKIGNLDIYQVEDASYRVVIETSNGTVFKSDETTSTLTATLYLGRTPITDTDSVSYQWYRNKQLLADKNEQSITISGAELGNNTVIYSCDITVEKKEAGA